MTRTSVAKTDDPFGDKAFIKAKRPKPATSTERQKDVPSTAATERARGRGRPRLIESPDQMQEMAESYFAEREAANKPFTMAGLCYALGFSDRHSLSEYEKHKEYTATVKRLRLRVEQARLEDMVDKAKFTPGQIFDLKNNHGYVDKQEVEVTGDFAGILAQRRKKHA